MLKGWTSVTWDHWSIIKKVQETTAMASKDDLLLSTLNGGGEFSGIGLLKLLTGLFSLATPLLVTLDTRHTMFVS